MKWIRDVFMRWFSWTVALFIVMDWVFQWIDLEPPAPTWTFIIPFITAALLVKYLRRAEKFLEELEKK